MQQIADQFSLRCVTLTPGTGGAVIFCDDSAGELPGVPVQVVDTVGAGTAFTAATVLHLLAGHDIETVSRRHRRTPNRQPSAQTHPKPLPESQTLGCAASSRPDAIS